MRYFTRISFDGTNFHGWQIQQNANSVQAELNKALGMLLRKSAIETIGCGRTDTGVHAKKFFAHFDFEEIENRKEIIHQLNAILPHSIAVQSLFQVGEKDHARFSATSRTYIYRICKKKDPFLRNWAWHFTGNADIGRMNEMAALLLDVHDFSSFAKSNSQTPTNLCNITFAEWKIDGDEMIFKITADRFLRNMVRAIVGTLLDAGLNRIKKNEFIQIIESKNRSEAGFSAPAHGLYLSDITYPFHVE